MVQEEPTERDTCQNLIDHAALRSNDERLLIFHNILKNNKHLSSSNFNYLVKMMDSEMKHMKGFLGKNSEPWKKFLGVASKFPEVKIDLEACSSIVIFFELQVKFL